MRRFILGKNSSNGSKDLQRLWVYPSVEGPLKWTEAEIEGEAERLQLYETEFSERREG